MKQTLIRLAVLLLGLGATVECVFAGEESGTYRILGLGTPERVDFFREIMKSVPEVQIASLDFDKAEVTLRYNVATLFPTLNPKKPPTADDIRNRLDEKVRQAAPSHFSLKPLCAVPRDQLQRIEIKILIPDCRGCRLGTYYAIAKRDGVEQVNLSTDPSQIIVWIDASKSNREDLVEALKKARVGFPAE